jgi:hypothetical protein
VLSWRETGFQHLTKPQSLPSRCLKTAILCVEFAIPRSPPAVYFVPLPAMMKLCIFVGMTAGGCIGYFVPASLGLWWAYFISGIGSIAGVYLGWKLARHLER